ncbi:hypothetical protein ElyMa_006305600 [Elysia marginata]|uniref:Uncharacterized protein n=1 Tax=Elysia marginata TaxID=1093978 RepID=A0AAV4HFM6_9GAST|nr:hypothetical protein ElyMa_006305600 [Elysia marginata]
MPVSTVREIHVWRCYSNNRAAALQGAQCSVLDVWKNVWWLAAISGRPGHKLPGNSWARIISICWFPGEIQGYKNCPESSYQENISDKVLHKNNIVLGT